MNLKKIIGMAVLAILLLVLLALVYRDQLRQRQSSRLTARINASSLYLKAGPGEQFERLGLYPRWNTVALLGVAPGGRWYFVQTGDGKTGWMAGEFLGLPGGVDRLPEKEIMDATVITGSVLASDGVPGNDVSLYVSPKDDPDASSIVYTTGAGEFYVYLPPEATGDWVMTIGGINCKSRLMDAGCRMSQYYLKTIRQQFSLPIKAPILFEYLKANAWIKGSVRDAHGAPLPEALVVAESAAGSLSGQHAAKDGRFTLPLAAGEWQIHCLVGGERGETKTATIQDGQTIEGFELKGP